MTTLTRTLLLASVVIISAQLTSAQQSPGKVTINEPGIYELAALFRQADTVALVKIISGDTETYDVAVYKSEVMKNFKGATAGETVYFGPYLGTKLGWEYIVFLRRSPKTIEPKATSSGGYGTVHYSEVFDEGYTSMENSYECIFDGKDLAQQCDYGVRVCTDYIKLPKSIPTFPPRKEETSFGCRWVRRTDFLSLLDSLDNAKK